MKEWLCIGATSVQTVCSRWLWQAGAEEGKHSARGALVGQLAKAGAGAGLDTPQCVALGAP